MEMLDKALSALRDGQVIAYPTEAVYGLGCDPDNEVALQRLLEIKQRDPDKGLILIAAEFAQLQPYLASVSVEQLQVCLATWPGPYTWLIPKHQGLSHLLSGRHATLAVRVTAHPIASALCRAFSRPLVSTSANLAGQPPARTAAEVRLQLSDKIGCIVEGEVDRTASPSEIRDLLTNEIIRGT